MTAERKRRPGYNSDGGKVVPVSSCRGWARVRLHPPSDSISRYEPRRIVKHYDANEAKRKCYIMRCAALRLHVTKLGQKLSGVTLRLLGGRLA